MSDRVKFLALLGMFFGTVKKLGVRISEDAQKKMVYRANQLPLDMVNDIVGLFSKIFDGTHPLFDEMIDEIKMIDEKPVENNLN